ncbi:hypothetical protein TTHERM_00723430 (macronuclear) [Tetrahymena thermophila SB210]|uniref:Uncharacterized protein n=1 Tax=Tetrahymena thermophila (strain SB210) TaxID=312017 RepID=I7LT33_TETTS|nr:hypothetical protein TTHERM_00723430 [Tetrahymena thermophila SB210]EAR84158.1 hypothetical protein TTHERM_00723430 [Tetrahymena thermophila SB210]|eukprot:XP_001031821.1 hypothetical protein TTHERM_00723430 [Tetrahymena thermophila SB210]
MEMMEDDDYYSDSNGMVHCGYHIDKKARYINISQICDVSDRLVCQECYLFLKMHSKMFDCSSFVDIDDIFDENYQFHGLKGITKQLDQLNNLEKVQMKYMNDIEMFYENIKREFVEQVDQCKKKILSLFTIQLDQQNIFKEQLEQLLRFDSFRYFVRTMSTHPLQCEDIEQFLQEQFKISQTLDEITQNYIYSPEMIQFFAQIEQLKKVSKTNKLKDLINDLQLQQSCNTFFSRNNNYQFTNRQLVEQIHHIDSKLQIQHSRKDSLDEQLQFIEKQKQSVMEIQSESFEDCDMFFLPSIVENRNIQQDRQNIIKQNHNRSSTGFLQQIIIPKQVKYQLFSSSPLINSYTYEFGVEFLNQPQNECSIDIVQEKKKNKSDFKYIINKKHDLNIESSFQDIFNSCNSLIPGQVTQFNIRVNISKKTMLIYNQSYKKNIELTNLNNHTNYRLSLTFTEQSQVVQIRLTGVKLVF